jgi:hypothetical protein
VETAVHAFEQTNADLLSVQSEDVADRLERERRTIAARANPPLGLAKELAPVVVARASVLMKAACRVEQHRPEQPSLPQSDPKPTPELDLGGENDFRKGLKSLSRPGCIMVDLHGVRCVR